jgi:hypothetical protein
MYLVAPTGLHVMSFSSKKIFVEEILITLVEKTLKHMCNLFWLHVDLLHTLLICGGL